MVWTNIGDQIWIHFRPEMDPFWSPKLAPESQRNGIQKMTSSLQNSSLPQDDFARDEFISSEVISAQK